MTRKVLVALLPLALGGCLPIPISIASSAIAGVSYLTSGKSTTDHVLSATMEQDCALTRPVFGEPVCRDIGPDGEGRTPAVTVAYYPGDRDDGLPRSDRIAAGNLGALDLSAVDEEAKQVAVAPRYLAPPPRVSVAGIIVTKEQIVPAPDSEPMPVAGDAKWGPSVPAKTLAAVAMPSEDAIERPSAARTNAAEPGDRWVVLGSFLDTDRAQVMASRFADQRPQILPATVRGETWHRVVLGPMSPVQARQVRDDLGKVDGRQPWVVQVAAR